MRSWSSDKRGAPKTKPENKKKSKSRFAGTSLEEEEEGRGALVEWRRGGGDGAMQAHAKKEGNKHQAPMTEEATTTTTNGRGRRGDSGNKIHSSLALIPTPIPNSISIPPFINCILILFWLSLRFVFFSSFYYSRTN